MPPLSPQKALGQPVFLAGGHKMPVSFQRPSGDPEGQQYSDAFQPNDKIATPQLTPPWFLPAEPNRYYQETCDKIGKNYKDFHDAMIDAVVFSHTLWKAQAKFQNIIINAVAAAGTPGCLDGPELEANIKSAPMVASFTGNKAKHRDAVAKGVSKCFANWQKAVTVPMLPWYPAFAMFPGPMAAPVPNVPTPLAAAVSAAMPMIVTPMPMASEMDNALDAGLKREDKDKHYASLHKAIATVLALAFAEWLPKQQIIGVIGKGQIPTFAPPVVPAGPVVMGDIISTPGHLVS